MYLTDYRERYLKDVITQLEPGLFKKVTSLDVKEFELLVSLSVFNDALTNDAVYKFKRYEDISLSYIMINRHEGEDHGSKYTVITVEDYHNMFALQQALMEVPELAADYLPEKLFFMDFEEAVKSLDEKEPIRKVKMVEEKPVLYKVHFKKTTYVLPTLKPV